MGKETAQRTVRSRAAPQQRESFIERVLSVYKVTFWELASFWVSYNREIQKLKGLVSVVKHLMSIFLLFVSAAGLEAY